MRLLAIAFGVLISAAFSNMAGIGHFDRNKKSTIEKRETQTDSVENFNSFLEEKLMQQSQALEHLIKAVDNSGDMIKKLINNLSKGIEKPKLPAKAEVEELGSRRSFGSLSPELIAGQKFDDDKIDPWCPLALLCEKNLDPICGFDDEFGYGKFEDLCHMIRVNCYWKYNFAMVHSCRPML